MRYFKLALTVVTGLCFLFFLREQYSETLDNHKLPLEQRILGRWEHERARLYDPNTGTVPSERLLTARKHILKKLSNKDAIPNIGWEERGPKNVSGRTRAILVDARDATGNTVFAGGVSGGLWKSTNGGNSWSVINDFFNNLAITSIVQDPNNLNTIYFGTGEYWAYGSGLRGMGIYKSTNGGLTFSPVASTQSNRDFDYINRLAVQSYNGSTVLYAATASTDNTRGGLMISQNGGNSWLIWKGNNGGINDFASDVKVTVPDPTNPNNGNSRVLASFGNTQETDGIYFSSNGGTSWAVYWDPQDNNIGRIDLATSSDPYINYWFCESKANNLLPSLFGSYWNGFSYLIAPIVLPNSPGWFDNRCDQTSIDITRGQDFYDLALAVSPSNPYRLIIGGIDLWLYERNPTFLFDSWQQISNWAGLCNFPKVHADQHYILFENNNEVWVGNDGGVWKSNNANSNFPTFSFKGNDLNITQFYASDLHPQAGKNEYIAGSQDNGTQFFETQGINATTEVFGGDGAFCHIDQSNPNIQIAAYVHQAFAVTLNGWSSHSELRIPGSNGRFINPSDYDDVNKKLYAGDAPGRYLRWNNPSTGGNNYQIVTVSNFPTNLADGRAWVVQNSPNVNGRTYFGFDGGRVVQVDNANTGTTKSGKIIFDLNMGNGHAVSCVEIEDDNENHMLVTLSNYGITSIYESYNAQSANPSWTAVEGNLPDLPVRWAMFNPNNADQALIATELGVWSTDNLNGANTDWDPTNLGLANTRIDMLKYRKSDHQVIAATHGRGLYTTDDFNLGCNPNFSLSGGNLSGSYQASDLISLSNVTLTGNTSLNAPEVILNPTFDIHQGLELTITSDGCN